VLDDHHGSISVDVFLPPIGGHYTMDRHEAAAFARSVEPALVIPVHYDTFEAIETDVGAFAAELEEAGIRVEVIQAGTPCCVGDPAELSTERDTAARTPLPRGRTRRATAPP